MNNDETIAEMLKEEGECLLTVENGQGSNQINY